ncbi:MAG: helix-turn-helix domain-containing protein [Pseudomonadota bacterium]
MAKPSLTGSRIRERRIDRGLKQARLAELCDISASYLNLIEHNRRRIGGRLLNRIAEALEVTPQILAEGADGALLDALRDAAGAAPQARAEAPRLEEFAGRFPGWAQLVAAQSRRIGSMERTVEVLNDRLTHDPFLSASLHDILSTVTAIRSASGILAGDEEVDPEWQARFHRNIYEDSQRLADASQALVSYLDAGADADKGVAAPQEELEAWLEGQGYHISPLERALPPEISSLIESASVLTSPAATALARDYLVRYRKDAEAMPLPAMREALAQYGPDPAALARAFEVDLASVFRRMAALPDTPQLGAVGLAICDASGTLTFRKPVDGFSLPRFGAACPLLPLYQALARPMSPVRTRVEQAGRRPRRFLAYAISQPAHPAGFDGPVVFEASMLVLPDDGPGRETGPVEPIGTSCRICSRGTCAARREPSILADG